MGEIRQLQKVYNGFTTGKVTLTPDTPKRVYASSDVLEAVVVFTHAGKEHIVATDKREHIAFGNLFDPNDPFYTITMKKHYDGTWHEIIFEVTGHVDREIEILAAYDIDHYKKITKPFIGYHGKKIKKLELQRSNGNKTLTLKVPRFDTTTDNNGNAVHDGVTYGTSYYAMARSSWSGVHAGAAQTIKGHSHVSGYYGRWTSNYTQSTWILKTDKWGEMDRMQFSVYEQAHNDNPTLASLYEIGVDYIDIIKRSDTTAGIDVHGTSHTLTKGSNVYLYQGTMYQGWYKIWVEWKGDSLYVRGSIDTGDDHRQTIIAEMKRVWLS